MRLLGISTILDDCKLMPHSLDQRSGFTGTCLTDCDFLRLQCLKSQKTLKMKSSKYSWEKTAASCLGFVFGHDTSDTPIAPCVKKMVKMYYTFFLLVNAHNVCKR